jgi:SAM-dependent methyltransferase
MKQSETNRPRAAVRARYAAAVRAAQKTPAGSCCAPVEESQSVGQVAHEKSRIMGYSKADLDLLPEGADLGLGCGNPMAIAELRPRETVVDLGSGGGIDCFPAAQRVGPEGRVIGVDMTPDMLSLARANADNAGISNVEFRLGEIEHLPIADASVDAIISNCVINLSPDKEQVFRDAFRVLKQGGRMCISDVVATRPVPQIFRDDEAMVCGCMGGAATVEQLRAWLDGIGFVDTRIDLNEKSRGFIKDWAPGSGIEDYVASAVIRARKPQ